MKVDFQKKVRAYKNNIDILWELVVCNDCLKPN